MKKLLIYLFTLFICYSNLYAEEKEPITTKRHWDKSNDRDNNSLQLYQDNSHVYVYSEKQLDNLYIGITDMQGNVYYEETTTVPASTYYAISIESLPQGMYYLSIIQGGNYVIGIFTK